MCRCSCIAYTLALAFFLQVEKQSKLSVAGLRCIRAKAVKVHRSLFHKAGPCKSPPPPPPPPLCTRTERPTAAGNMSCMLNKLRRRSTGRGVCEDFTLWRMCMRFFEGGEGVVAVGRVMGRKEGACTLWWIMSGPGISRGAMTGLRVGLPTCDK